MRDRTVFALDCRNSPDCGQAGLPAEGSLMRRPLFMACLCLVIVLTIGRILTGADTGVKTFHQNNLLSGALAMPALTGAAAVSGCRSTTTNMATMSSAFGIGQNMPGFVMEMSSMAK